MPQDYNKTLQLPQTEFPMRAGLPQKEPQTLEKWEKEGLYDKIMARNEGKPLFVLHDGPPYANGDIHLGTALNKVLKDFAVRYHNMAGYKAPYVPGWDTHGLPIELKARKKAGIDADSAVTANELREICKEFALGYVQEQKKSFQRLGVLGEWDNPYLTLKPEFEARQVEIFGEMALKGYIYKGLKPVYWCPECQTALAEAEIEYAEDPCHSIYVKFRVTDDLGKLSAFGADPQKTSFVIWTTTTWTLPGNVAICVGPEYTYAVVKAEDEYYVMAEELASSAMAAADIKDYEVIGTLQGRELEYMKTAHPFMNRDSLVIVGDHVTLESGTGCVHTAPGHGVEDFEVCRNYPELPVVVPVDNKGYLNEEAGEFKGLSTDEANKAIAKKLDEQGSLFALTKIIHQYPHCWRCSQPVLFRATEQSFCSVDGFKDQALKAIQAVKWIPGWGEERISNMVRDRSDWCISRQRVWGVPIPLFYCEDCGEQICTKETIQHVANLFRKNGSGIWFEREAKDLMPEGVVCPKCGGIHFIKEKDIMDVWFDSGVTHAAVCEERDSLHWPADLYLEGADQYRGWFQSSLLTSVAWRGVAPYKKVVTHGWVVDGEGRKMSKSLGNGILPEEIVNQYGADILRLWVASSDYHADIRISKDILKQLSEGYRKIRNTARFILGCLGDFDPDRDSVAAEQLESIDRWALLKCDALLAKVREAYENYEYHQVYHAVHNFCVVDLSNFYLDVLKDRLYVEGAESVTRRAAQTVIYRILDSLVLMLAPILAYTAEEIWSYLPPSRDRNRESVMLNDMPAASLESDPDFMAYWDRIHALRDDVQKALEAARSEKIIGASLEARVTLTALGEQLSFLRENAALLPKVFIVSELAVEEGNQGVFQGDTGVYVTVAKASGQKCQRCWQFSKTVGSDLSHPELCRRCAGVLSDIH